MSNLALEWNPKTLSADLTTTSGQSSFVYSLRTAVIISLFSDRLAEPDDPLPVANGDRRGYWGDLFTPGRLLGSRLWLLSRAIAIDETRKMAIRYATEALDWMIKDQVAQKITIDAAWFGLNKLVFKVIICRQDATGNPVNHAFDLLWSTELGLAA